MAAAASGASYGRGARILSIGIAATGVLTFAYFSIASHVLSAVEAKRIDLVWSIMFVIISVIYRPVEQLLSRTIAQRRARGLGGHPLRVPIVIQAGFAVVFAVVALSLHETLVNHVLDGHETLYWVLVSATLAYAASYFARGWLAGHEYFGLYGGLVLMESVSRVCFGLAVAVGVASGEGAVALGMTAAPFVSLVVVPWAFAGARTAPVSGHHGDVARPRARSEAGRATGKPAAGSGEGPDFGSAGDLTLGGGARFAVSVSGVMLAEQALLNAAVLTVAAGSSNGALAGIVFNVLLIARAPLQLFQSVQTSLLPHLAGLDATDGHGGFARAVRITLASALGFGVLVALGLLAVGPPVMTTLFGQHFHYGRVGLAVVGLGMGLHLCAGTLNQAALARGRAGTAAAVWLAVAAAFLVWLTVPIAGDQLLRAEVGYAGAAALLVAGLGVLYRANARDALAQDGDAAATAAAISE